MFILRIIFLILFFSSCGNLFYFPHRKMYTTPEVYEVKHENIYFQSTDLTELHGWLLKSKQASPKALIIHFHGNAENISTHFFQLAWLTNFNFNVFTADYREFGESEGEANRRGVYEDSLAIISKGLELAKRENIKTIILWGQSLGGNIALKAATKFPNDINLLILDSTFLSYQKIAKDRMQTSFITYLFSPLSYVLLNEEYSASEVYNEIKMPTLVLHGKKDRTVPVYFGEELFNLINPKSKSLMLFENMDHLQVFSVQKNREDVLNKINQFLADGQL